MLAIVVDGLAGLQHTHGTHCHFPCIQVAIETREVAAGDIYSNLMSFLKQITGCPKIDRVFGDFSRCEQLGFSSRVPITSPNNAVRQVASVTTRLDVSQPGGEVDRK